MYRKIADQADFKRNYLPKLSDRTIHGYFGLTAGFSAYSLRSACARVLSVIDDWESIDITSIDIEDTISRFTNLQAINYKPKSLEVYGKRFRKAIESYLDYIRDPGAWKPTSRQIQTINTSVNNK